MHLATTREGPLLQQDKYTPYSPLYLQNIYNNKKHHQV